MPGINRVKQLARHVLKSQEEQRRAISRELHDHITQVLVAAIHRLGTVEASVGNSALCGAISEVRADLDEMLDRVGVLARRLRPGAVECLGLIPALEKHAASFAEHARLSLAVEMSAPSAAHLDGERSIHLFRIAEEALANIEKHAGASEVALRLFEAGGRLRLEVSDNGRSFAAARETEAQGAGRLGLLGMRERAAMLGGRLEIEAVQGKGTTICASIPVPAGREGKTRQRTKHETDPCSHR